MTGELMVKPEFEAKVVRIGNSYGVRIPSEWLKVLDVEHGDKIKLEITQKPSRNGSRGKYTMTMMKVNSERNSKTS